MANTLDFIIDVSTTLWNGVVGMPLAGNANVESQIKSIGFVPAYALQQILAATADPDPKRRSNAYYWAFITFLANLSFAQASFFKNWHTRRCYERTRGILMCAIHYKTLSRLDGSGRASSGDQNSGANLGKIVNLMQCVVCYLRIPYS